MIDPIQVSTMLAETFRCPLESLEILPLFGDASSRRYYRLRWQERGLARSAILMVMTDSSDARTSDESGNDCPPEIEEIPFVNVQKHLARCHSPVPEIYTHRASLGWLLLEDLGDISLHTHVQECAITPQARLDVYKNAISLLVDMQCKATPAPKESSIAHLRHFNHDLFLWEFEHFVEYGIEHRTGFKKEEEPTTFIPRSKRQEILDYFSKISKEIASLPQVFTHRDYHSRNLMVQSGPEGINIRLIDFQDALMGPAEYDLASLLRDSYVALPDDEIDELLAYCLETTRQRSGSHQHLPAKDFRKRFDLISIQRNLKAAGRFIFIDKVKNKDHLLPYVSPTLYKVRQTLSRYPHLKPLHQLLAKYVPELR